MKILYLRTYFKFGLKAGGSVGHTAGVINSLRKKAEIKIYSNDYLPEVKSEVKIIKPFKVKVGLINNLLEILYNFKLLRILNSEIKQYDLIYHRYTGNSFVAARLAKKYSVPLVLEFNSSAYWAIKHWNIKQSFPKNILRYLFNHFIRLPLTYFIEKYNIENATLIVVVSEPLKENLIKAGFPGKKILVNPNGVDPDKFSNAISGNVIRKQLQISKEKIVFGFIGTFGQWHGIVELAKAILLFYNKYPEETSKTIFMLIGDGILMKEVKRIIFSSSYKNNVILTGLIKQNLAPEYLAACDICLSPHIKNPDGSKFFGSPTKLFEYLSMGKPVIASNLDQIGDIITHGKNGYLVPPGDIEALASAMIELSKNEPLRKKLGQQARRLVLQKYTWDKHVDNIIKKITELTGIS